MAMELPSVFALMGAASLPDLEAVVRDRTQSSWTRVVALDGLEALANPSLEHTAEQSTQQQYIDLLMGELSQFTHNESDFNAFLVGALVKFQVMEAVPLMEQAFAAGKVDEGMYGDWHKIQVRLGLQSPDAVPRNTTAPHLSQPLGTFDRKTPLPKGFGKSSGHSSPSNRQTQQKPQSRHNHRKQK